MPAGRWAKFWCAGVVLYSSAWAGLTIKHHIDRHALTRDITRQLQWAGTHELPSDELNRLLDDAQAPPMRGERVAAVDDFAAQAASERVIGSERLERTVYRRVVEPRVHSSQGKACIALALFAADLAANGAVDAVRAASRLVEIADERCRHGLVSVSEAELSLLAVTARRRINPTALYERQLSLSRLSDYEPFFTSRGSLLSADFESRVSPSASRRMPCLVSSSGSALWDLFELLVTQPVDFVRARRQVTGWAARVTDDEQRVLDFSRDFSTGSLQRGGDREQDDAIEAVELDSRRSQIVMGWLHGHQM